MVSMGIIAPLPLPKYPRPVLTPGGGNLNLLSSLNVSALDLSFDKSSFLALRSLPPNILSRWYTGGPTYSLRFSGVTRMWTSSGMIMGGASLSSGVEAVVDSSDVEEVSDEVGVAAPPTGRSLTASSIATSLVDGLCAAALSEGGVEVGAEATSACSLVSPYCSTSLRAAFR